MAKLKAGKYCNLIINLYVAVMGVIYFSLKSERLLCCHRVSVT